MDKPELLYHGSLYKQKELMPGFKRSGKLAVWDGVESNLNLYVSSDKREAELLGIGSAVEKEFNSNRFVEINGDIWIFADKLITLEEFLKLTIYVYTIPFRDSDEWQKNNNPYNNIDTEWTTRNTIHNVTVEEVNIREVMKGKVVTVTTAPIDTDFKMLLRRYPDQVLMYRF